MEFLACTELITEEERTKRTLTTQRPPRRHRRQNDTAEPILQRHPDDLIELAIGMLYEVVPGGVEADEGRIEGDGVAVVVEFDGDG